MCDWAAVHYGDPEIVFVNKGVFYAAAETPHEKSVKEEKETAHDTGHA